MPDYGLGDGPSFLESIESLARQSGLKVLVRTPWCFVVI